MSDIHPGLKSAIDKGNVKTAETLVKKIGVKDVYCPDELSYKDALQIYGDAFENDPARMWENCGSAFIKKAEENVCKTHVSLCRYYLRNADFALLEKELGKVLDSKLYKQKKKVKIQKKMQSKTTTRECLENLEEDKLAATVILAAYQEFYCYDASSILCPFFYVIADSVHKSLVYTEKMCKTNPVKTEEKEVEVLQDVNPFLYEIEKYGIAVSQEMKNPLFFNKNSLDLYKSLKKNNMVDDSSKTRLVAAFRNNDRNGRCPESRDFLAACLAYPKFDFLFKAMNQSCRKLDCSDLIGDESNSILLTTDKMRLIKSLTSDYAKTGYVSDSLIAFSCRLYPEIDKEIFRITSVEIFDCSVLTELARAKENCLKTDSSYIWKSGTNHSYVCENRNLRVASISEETMGMICTQDRNDSLVNDYICENQMWREASKAEKITGMICTQNRQGLFVNNYICENQTWRVASDEELITKKACTFQNIGEVKFGMRCKENVGWVKTLIDSRDGKEYETTKIRDQIWMAENLNYNYNFGDAKSVCFDNVYYNCDETKYGRFYNWSAAINACPAGWHLPSVREWEILFREIDDDAATLKSKKGWNKNSGKGHDNYGFSALPAGGGWEACRLENIEASLEELSWFDFAAKKRLLEVKDECEKNPYRFSAGENAIFWTSSISSDRDDAMIVIIGKDISTANKYKNDFAPIRCIYGNSRR